MLIDDDNMTTIVIWIKEKFVFMALADTKLTIIMLVPENVEKQTISTVEIESSYVSIPLNTNAFKQSLFNMHFNTCSGQLSFGLFIINNMCIQCYCHLASFSNTQIQLKSLVMIVFRCIFILYNNFERPPADIINNYYVNRGTNEINARVASNNRQWPTQYLPAIQMDVRMPKMENVFSLEIINKHMQFASNSERQLSTKNSNYIQIQIILFSFVWNFSLFLSFASIGKEISCH